MNILESHLLLAGAWLLWCALHSALIAEGWMRAARRRLGARVAYYRLAYVLFSTATFAPVLWLQLTIDSPLLWEWPAWLKPLQWAGLLVSGLIFVLAARQYDQRFFLGLRQIAGHLRGSAAEYSGFAADGILRRMRHPYYSAGMLLLLCWGDVTAANLVMKLIGIAYFVVGAWLEERKLIAQFGEDYLRYRREVPMFVPRLRVASRGGSA